MDLILINNNLKLIINKETNVHHEGWSARQTVIVKQIIYTTNYPTEYVLIGYSAPTYLNFIYQKAWYLMWLLFRLFVNTFNLL